MTKAKTAVARSRPKAAPRPAANPDGLEATLHAIDTALRTYAPTLKSKLHPASSLAELEKLTPVPAPLHALWSWSDGCPGFLWISATFSDSAVDFLSVKEAASTLAGLREALDDEGEVATFSGIPFATEQGSGNYLVLDGAGRVGYWDHETGELESGTVAVSLDALLARTLASIKKKRLFGGPERRPGEIDPRVKRVEALLEDPVNNYQKIMGKTANLLGRNTGLGPADCYRIRLGLVGFHEKDPRFDGHRDDFYSALAFSAIEVGALEDAYGYLETAGVGTRLDRTFQWTCLGIAALRAGAFELAAKAYARDPYKPDYGGLFHVTSSNLVGVAVALWKLGGDTKAAVAAAKQAFANDLAVGHKSVGYPTLLCSAVIAHIEGDAPTAKRLIEEARAYPKDGGLIEPEDCEFAIIAGLFPSKGAA